MYKELNQLITEGEHLKTSDFDLGFFLLGEGDDSIEQPDDYLVSFEERTLHPVKAPYSEIRKELHRECEEFEKLRENISQEPTSYGCKQKLFAAEPSSDEPEIVCPAMHHTKQKEERNQSGAKSNMYHHSTRIKFLIRRGRLDSPKH